MKVGQTIKLTIGSKAYKYKVSMKSELKNGIWIKTLRGKKQFLLNLKTLSWNENGTNLTASKMLGHKDLKTTQVYAKIVDEAKREAVNKIKLDL